MLRVSGIKIDVKSDEKTLKKKTAKILNIKEDDIKSIKIIKRSVDARKKEIKFVYTVDAEVKNESGIRLEKGVTKCEDKEYIPFCGTKKFEKRPVVIGFGPAGMFCALVLAASGARPIVLERGENVDERSRSVEEFWKTGRLNTESNVQFGEGGAGTFSDGKLTTRIKNERCKYVLSAMVEAGAPKEITYVHNPHIGTDVLKSVVRNIRGKITELGGEVRFGAKVTDIGVCDGSLKYVEVNGCEKIYCDYAAAALGHSARDTFYMLKNHGMKMEQKPFAVGARIEHKQSMINKAQYGDPELAGILGPAEYRLTYTAKNGRGVYTFCMCPGGQVVAASSEEGLMAVNGMSYHSRNGKNANSAVLVQVFPEDFGSDDPLAGVELQRKIEKRAFEAGGGGYIAPAQRVGAFLGGKYAADVEPTCKPGVRECELRGIFPDFVTDAIAEALPEFDKKIKGFADPGAILTAPESRSSSPVRLLRDGNTGQSINIAGLFPAGEGAGYAGGIMSAAVDGVITAEKMLEANEA